MSRPTQRGGAPLRAVVLAFALVLVTIGTAAAAIASGPASASAGSAVPAAQPCQGADCEVVPDPKDAQYVGTGGLLLPADSFTGSDADRSDAATCPECRWALLPMCRGGEQGGGVACGGAAASCPPGQFRRIVLLLRPGDTDWREVGLVCLVDGAPVTIDDVADELSDVVVEQVPPLRPDYQPHGGTLIGLPAIFGSGQPARLGERSFELVGFQIVLDGRATWTWSFGDGETLTTEEPGGPWPDAAVAHTYARPGEYPVEVTASWQAWFTVDGLGPWPVAGDPVEQTEAPPLVQVVEARAELLAG